MNTTRSTSSNSTGALLPRSLTMAIVGFGPVASVLWLMGQSGHHWLPADALGPVLLGVLFMWSPQPISLPALLLQDGRDAAMPTYRGVIGSTIRGFKLIPYLMTNPASTIRPEMIASVVGFLAAVLVVAAH